MPHLSSLRLLAVLLATCLLGTVLGTAAIAADGPTPYPDAKNETAWPGKGPIRTFDWMPINRAAFWKQRQADHGKVVFVGDSLTAGWKDLPTNFPGIAIANRGIGGDTSRGLLFRFNEDVLDLAPRAIVLCIGSNDLSAHGDPAAIEANITAMLTAARKQRADVPIVLCTIAPRDNPKAPTKPGAHADINRRLTALAASQHVILFDLFTTLADANGGPKAEVVGPDRLHLTAEGYHQWAAALQPVLAKALTP
jgi:lysophospholipase L1-like esterase